MLHEIKNVKQEVGAQRRRWFQSNALELIVWLDNNGETAGFQLCYNVGRGEHALTWRSDSDFTHSAVDTGDDSPLENDTPVLEPAGDAPWVEIKRLFDKRAQKLEPELREFIRDKLSRRVGVAAA